LINSISPTTDGGGPQEAVSTPMRTGASGFMASTVPGSRQTSSAQSITAAPPRPLSRFCALTGQQQCMWRDSACITAPKALPPPWCGLDIGIVILLEDVAVSEKRRRGVADQLHIVHSGGVPCREFLVREGCKGPAQPRGQVEGLQIVRIEPPVDTQGCTGTPAVPQHSGHVGEPQAPGVASNGAGHVSHIPAVYFTLADLAPECKQPAHAVHYRADERSPRGMWVLNGDDLEISAHGQGLPDAPLTVLRAPSPRDFALVPHMQTICPDLHGLEVHEECLAPHITRLSDVGLVGRLRLQAGVVGAYDGQAGQYISADEFMFTHSPSHHRQRLASCVVFETSIDAPTVELYSRQRGHGLVLRPQDGQAVEILLENEPLAKLMAARPNDPDTDYDFELLYRIARNPPAPLRVPIRATAAVSRLAVAGAPGPDAGGVSCPSQLASSVILGSKCGLAANNPSREVSSGAAGSRCSLLVYNPSSEASSAQPNSKCALLVYNPSNRA
jgi:hypothetical protein